MKNANVMRTFENLMDGLLDGRVPTTFREEPTSMKMQPPVNIYESEHGFEIEVLAVGLNKEDIKLTVDKNLLTIAYDRQESATEKKGKLLRNEFNVKSFKRSFTLGETVDAKAIQAQYEQGILTLTIPKKVVEQPKPIEITVQ